MTTPATPPATLTDDTADPISTPARIDPGVYATATPCEHETEVRVGIAAYAYRRDPQGAQCRACNRRWRLRFSGDPERGLQALWQETQP